MSSTKKGRVFSGMRPTGQLHLGNYLGALENWVRLQDDYECFFCVVDWHALTTGYEETAGLKENVRQMVIDWLSAGIDPEKSVVFRQSDVKEHAELHLLLSMITPLSWLERNPTYKEQLQQLATREISTYGFLGYPVLQAADILAYKGDTVPVGEDQLPHLELSREIARRFNFLYRPVFPEPQARMNQVTLLPGLDNRKMSKSYGNYIAMAASERELGDAVTRMITDPARIRRDDPGHPEVCTVFAYHKIFSPDAVARTESECRAGKIGCVACKKNLSQTMNQFLAPIRERRQELETHPERVDEILAQGARRARAVSSQVLAEVREAMRIE
ncbi:MAG: tryptophan--tRNA ligase [Firmicutes bacterium]|nr:tryptophan--tRNA ligase [Bacillota bacterium]